MPKGETLRSMDAGRGPDPQEAPGMLCLVPPEERGLRSKVGKQKNMGPSGYVFKKPKIQLKMAVTIKKYFCLKQ